MYGYEGGNWLEDVASDSIDLIAEKVFNFGYKVSFQTIDKGLLEVCGPAGVSKTIHELGDRKMLVQMPFLTDTRACLAATLVQSSVVRWRCGGLMLFPGECT